MPRDRFMRERELRVRSSVYSFSRFDAPFQHSGITIDSSGSQWLRVKCSSCENETELHVIPGEYVTCVSLKNFINKMIPKCPSCGTRYSYELV